MTFTWSPYAIYVRDGWRHAVPRVRHVDSSTPFMYLYSTHSVPSSSTSSIESKYKKLLNVTNELFIFIFNWLLRVHSFCAFVIVYSSKVRDTGGVRMSYSCWITTHKKKPSLLRPFREIFKQIKLGGPWLHWQWGFHKISHFVMKVLTQLPSPRPFPPTLGNWTGKKLGEEQTNQRQSIPATHVWTCMYLFWNCRVLIS